MSEFATYVQLGIRHITDPRGLDHVLFLLALAAVYRLGRWREIAWTVTAFTVGHSLTLALSALHLLTLPTATIEFLIPVTIVLASLGNVLGLDDDRATPAAHARLRPILAAVFGLVHGAGFANYLQSLFVERVALPLFAFNVGIEVGQLAVLLLAFLGFALIDGMVAACRPASWRVTPLRFRVVGVSLVVGMIAARWSVERW